MIRAIAWKELREQGLIALTLVVLGGGLLAAAATLAEPPAQGASPTDVVAYLGLGRLATLMLAVTAGMVCGGAVFAAEREAATFSFLDSLPASRWQIWRAKVLAGLGLAFVQMPAPRRAGRRAGDGSDPRVGDRGRRLFPARLRLGRLRLHPGADHARVGRHRHTRRDPDRVLGAHPGHALLPEPSGEHAARQRRNPLPRCACSRRPSSFPRGLSPDSIARAPPRMRRLHAERLTVPKWSPRRERLRPIAQPIAPRRSRLGVDRPALARRASADRSRARDLGVRPALRTGPAASPGAALHRLAGAGSHGRSHCGRDRVRR